MAVLSPNGELVIRQYPQWIRGKYLSIAPSVTVFTCIVDTVNTDSVSNGVYSFTYTDASGAYTDIVHGMTICVGSTAGNNDIGVLRVRKNATSSIIYCNERALGKVAISSNDYITIIDEYRPWQKMLRLVAEKENGSSYENNYTEYHDYDISYTDENSNIQPQANITGGSLDDESPKPVKFAGFVDTGETFRTVDLDASHSFYTAHGASSLTYLWDINDGSFVSGYTSTDETIQATFPITANQFRYISLTVSDNLGNSHTQRIPIWVHNSEYMPITSMTITNDSRDQWRSMSFEFYGDDNDFDETVIREGAVICYWEHDAKFQNDSAPDEYISQFMGWAGEESVKLKIGKRSLYNISVYGSGWWLSKIGGFAQILTHKSTTPDKWYDIINMTDFRIFHYVLREYCNILNLVPLYHDLPGSTIEREPIPDGAIWSECESLIEGFEYSSIYTDSGGAIWVMPQYQYLSMADRASRGRITTLTKQDWEDDSGLEITRQYGENVGKVVATGSSFTIGATESVVYGSKAPGDTPGESGTKEEPPFQRLPSSGAQAKLNTLTGMHYAYKNSMRNVASVRLVGNMDVFEPAWGQPIKIIWSDDNVRGETLEADFIIKSVNVEHSSDRGNRQKVITLNLEEATIGISGVYDKIEKDVIESPTTLPNISFPEMSYPDITYAPVDIWGEMPGSEPITIPAYPGVLLAISGEPGCSILQTSNANTPESEGGPTWTRTQLNLDGSGLQFKVDPFSSCFVTGSDVMDGIIVTTTKIYFIADLYNAKTVTELFSFRDTTEKRSFDISFGEEYRAVVCSVYSDGCYETHTDDMENWSEEQEYAPASPCSDDDQQIIVEFESETTQYEEGETELEIPLVLTTSPSPTIDDVYAQVVITNGTPGSSLILFPSGTETSTTKNINVTIVDDPVTLLLEGVTGGASIGGKDTHIATAQESDEFDFTAGQNGWYTIYLGGETGTYSAAYSPGVGWVDVDYIKLGPTRVRRVAGIWYDVATYPATKYISSVTVYFDYVAGTFNMSSPPYRYEFEHSGDSLHRQTTNSISTGTGQSKTTTVGVSTHNIGILFYACNKNNTPFDGDVIITKVVVNY